MLHYPAIYLFILFGGFFSIILGIGQIIIIRRKGNHIVLALLLCFIGIYQLSNGSPLLIELGLIQKDSLWLQAGLVSFYAVGPLQYTYFMNIIKARSLSLPYILINLIPFFLVTMIIILPSALTGIKPSHFSIEGQLHQTIAISSVGLYLLYHCRVTILFIKIFRHASGERRSVLIFAGIIIVALFLLAVLWFFILFSPSLMPFIHFTVTIIITGIFLFSYLQPALLFIISLEAESIRYKNTRVDNLDIKTICNRLNDIMTAEKMYCNDNLTLAALASRVDVTQHQLSEILNRFMNRNYASYINEFRVREAERMLHDDPELTVLDAAMAVGFNSTSAFYNAFKRYFGVSPSQVRKKKN
ncbi:MAG: hypothetical protein CVV44_16850 [Spirochaetae bacterium HGW-Spirochaetae-1]|jgi:AraC-like DNA-binding protein|nr:MAG: hypothetical protein CVV44_16850 [Spirochaetae bacterium HGW-Spirochaetae-1]